MQNSVTDSLVAHFVAVILIHFVGPGKLSAIGADAQRNKIVKTIKDESESDILTSGIRKLSLNWSTSVHEKEANAERSSREEAFHWREQIISTLPLTPGFINFLTPLTVSELPHTVWSCLRKNGTLDYASFVALDLSLQSDYVGRREIKHNLRCWIRWTAKPNMGISIRIKEKNCINDHDVQSVYELRFSGLQNPWVRRLVDICDSRDQDYLGNTNEIVMFLQVQNTTFHNTFAVEFLVRSLNHLEVQIISKKQGFIQTPLYGHRSAPTFMDSVIFVPVPDDHVVMVSFENVHLQPNTQLRIHPMGYRPWFSGKAELMVSKVKLFSYWGMTNLIVSFKDCRTNFVYNGEKIGFRLVYSFLERPTSPKQTNPEKGVWNCSVLHWPTFQIHLDCNLWVQCEDGRDEEQCNYIRCGASGFSVDGKCYTLGSEPTTVAMDEKVICPSIGARLVSFNTLQEMQKVLAVLWRKRVFSFHVGLRYKNAMIWPDKTIAYEATYTNEMYDGGYRPLCALMLLPDNVLNYEEFTTRLNSFHQKNLQIYNCLSELNKRNDYYLYLCEQEMDTKILGTKENAIPFQPVRSPEALGRFSNITCPAGHLTHCSLALDEKVACWNHDIMSKGRELWQTNSSSFWNCGRTLKALPQQFECDGNQRRVPFLLVCDHRQHCLDNSDEDFCEFLPCVGNTPRQCENSRQCYPEAEHCNNREWCVDGSDEMDCSGSMMNVGLRHKPLPPPAVVLYMHARFATTQLTPLILLSDGIVLCPETHFQCPGNGYCLPVFLRCNGVFDCPAKEDERGCVNAECPGYYRCRGSRVCVHPVYMCDITLHCTEGDDEVLCDFTCPHHCLCLGLSVKCNTTSGLKYLFNEIRALDLSGNDIDLYLFPSFSMLVYLDLSHCQITHLSNMSFPNLRILDLSWNSIGTIHTNDLQFMPNLRDLFLAQNPISLLFGEDFNRSWTSNNLTRIDLSGVQLIHIDVSVFDSFPNLQYLNLSKSDVERVFNSRHDLLSKLQHIDFRGSNLMEFPLDLFKHLPSLQQVFGDNYKLCCPQVLPPGFNLINCHAPVSEISSCNDLLRSNLYRAFLGIFAIFAVTGNISSLVIRMHSRKANTSSGYSVFVTHLSISDCFMGVYLVIVGMADRLYLNTYLWHDIKWRHSAMCQLAGFLALMSNEMSACVICLITIDRFLVIRFPFSPARFQSTSAHLACSILWVLVVLVVSIPLFPSNSHWRLYSQTGICIPLPITSNTFAGHNYAFGVMIVLNMILFLAIAAGQMAIYLAIKTNTITSVDSNKKQQELSIARRLITVAASDFLCWFPVGLLGLLSSTGTAIPDEVNIAIATLVIPLNSAINPFLYTMNVVLEKRRQMKEEEILKYLKAKAQNS